MILASGNFDDKSYSKMLLLDRILKFLSVVQVVACKPNAVFPRN